MATTSGFFDAQLDSSGNYDRVYNASEFAQYFHLFVGNGVFPDPSTQLQVVSVVPASMSIIVKPGYAWINGYYFYNSNDLSIDMNSAHASLPRIDLVRLRWNRASRNISIAIVKGTAASSPQAPALTRSADYYDIALAYIRVNAGVTSISQSSITDKRPDSSVCGWVTGLIDQIDTTNLFAQYNTAFNEWFSNVQAQLSGNVATNLQNQINQLVTKTNTLDSKIIPINQGGTGQTNVGAALYALIHGASTLSSSTVSTSDYIPLEEISTSLGKKITISNLITALNNGGLSKCAIVSYTGTGLYGESNPCSVTFPFAPKFVWLLGESGLTTLYVSSYGYYSICVFSELSTSYTKGRGFCKPFGNSSTLSYSEFSFAKKNGNTMSWYYAPNINDTEPNPTNAAKSQFNAKGVTYRVLGIG